MIKIEKTTYEVDGLKEPCYLVTNGYAVVRIAKCYHLIGRNTLTVTTFLEDEWNGEEEITGDFDESYEDDAEVCAKILGITLTRRSDDGTRMAGFPYHALDRYLPILVRKGHRIAICDQLEDPRLTKKLVKRGITELMERRAQ